MIGLALRLTVNGGREAVVRLVVTAAAVALGVAMVLTTLAGINAVNTQNARYAWLETGAVSPPPATGSDGLWWVLDADYVHGTIIGRLDVAATGPGAPVPPGIGRLPGPGEFYASPALSRLMRTMPAAELADRYPGKQIGTIGNAALPAPDTLLVVIGHEPGALAHVDGARKVGRIATTVPSSCNGNCPDIGLNHNGIDLILFVVVAALLFPMLIFIGSATRLSAARREQRFAAMRLVGATPRQISLISVVEATVGAALGMAGGFGLFFLIRPAIGTIPFTGARFFPADLALNVADILVVALGVPIAAAAVAHLAIRRVQVSPLGVTRRVTPRPPRAWRLLPLAAGLLELGYYVATGPPPGAPAQIRAYLPGLLLIMAGLVIAGPWLTMAGSRLMVRRTERATVLIAGRRLADDPKAGFRAVGGLVLALFVTTLAVAVISTFTSYRWAASDDPGAASTVVKDLMTYTRTGPRPAASVPSALVARLGSISGVTGVTVVHVDPSIVQPPWPSPTAVVLSCAELARTRVLGRCPAGAEAAIATPDLEGRTSQAATVWPAAPSSTAQVATLPVAALVVQATTPAAVERARTVLELAYPFGRFVPTTIGEIDAINQQQTEKYQQLADVVILVSLPIAACSLAVNVVAGLSDRKRPFSLLRLTGVPLGMLRRVVALESAVPLLAGAVVAILGGFVAAQLFLAAQLGYRLTPPGAGYYLIVAGGLVASLGIIAATLPLLGRITGPETARNE
jgi:hypothetical protein